MEDLVVLMRQVRAEHVTGEDDLPKHLLHVADLEQAHLLLRKAPCGACPDPMCAVEVPIAKCPVDAAGREQVCHLHVRFESLADSKELEAAMRK